MTPLTFRGISPKFTTTLSKVEEWGQDVKLPTVIGESVIQELDADTPMLQVTKVTGAEVTQSPGNGSTQLSRPEYSEHEATDCSGTWAITHHSAGTRVLIRLRGDDGNPIRGGALNHQRKLIQAGEEFFWSHTEPGVAFTIRKNDQTIYRFHAEFPEELKVVWRSNNRQQNILTGNGGQYSISRNHLFAGQSTTHINVIDLEKGILIHSHPLYMKSPDWSKISPSGRWIISSNHGYGSSGLTKCIETATGSEVNPPPTDYHGAHGDWLLAPNGQELYMMMSSPFNNLRQLGQTQKPCAYNPETGRRIHGLHWDDILHIQRRAGHIGCPVDPEYPWGAVSLYAGEGPDNEVAENSPMFALRPGGTWLAAWLGWDASHGAGNGGSLNKEGYLTQPHATAEIRPNASGFNTVYLTWGSDNGDRNRSSGDYYIGELLPAANAPDIVVELSPDGQKLTASASHNNLHTRITFEVFDINRSLRKRFFDNTSGVYLADGRYVAVAYADNIHNDGLVGIMCCAVAHSSMYEFEVAYGTIKGLKEILPSEFNIEEPDGPVEPTPPVVASRAGGELIALKVHSVPGNMVTVSITDNEAADTGTVGEFRFVFTRSDGGSALPESVGSYAVVNNNGQKYPMFSDFYRGVKLHPDVKPGDTLTAQAYKHAPGVEPGGPHIAVSEAMTFQYDPAGQPQPPTSLPQVIEVKLIQVHGPDGRSQWMVTSPDHDIDFVVLDPDH